MNPIDPVLTTLAEGQHGLVSRDQVVAAGFTRTAWSHRLQSGGWVRITPRVIRRAGAPVTEAQRALAAVLDTGTSTYVSHQSAAALWEVPGFQLDPIQVMSPRVRHDRRAIASVHRPRHLPEPFASEIDGIPVVRPALLILQLAPLVHPDKLGRIFDGLWSRRLLSAPSVRRELEPVLSRGRAGTRAVREVLDARPPGYVPPASNLEARFVQILRDHDLPAMRRQVDSGDQNGWTGRVDFRAIGLPLIVEVDSERFHSALSDVEADARRQASLEAAGFTVVRVSEFQVWHRPKEAAAIVRDGSWQARRRARAA